jgi:hypothetical protein
MIMSKPVRYKDIVRLKRDGLIIELDPYDKQQLDEWDRMCDEEMRQAGLLA